MEYRGDSGALPATFLASMVAPMTPIDTQVDALLRSPYTDGLFADLSVVFRYDTRDPFALSLVFCDGIEWTLSREDFEIAAAGTGVGAGDIIWSPAPEIDGCMNLFLTNGTKQATMVFSTANLGSVLERLPKIDSAISIRVKDELDTFLSRILESF